MIGYVIYIIGREGIAIIVTEFSLALALSLLRKSRNLIFDHGLFPLSPTFLLRSSPFFLFPFCFRRLPLPGWGLRGFALRVDTVVMGSFDHSHPSVFNENAWVCAFSPPREKAFEASLRRSASDWAVPSGPATVFVLIGWGK